jgi:hypothetical protein
MTVIEKLEHLLSLPKGPEFKIFKDDEGYRSSLSVTWFDGKSAIYYGLDLKDGKSVTDLNKAIDIIYDKVEMDVKEKTTFYHKWVEGFKELILYMAKRGK